MLLPLLPLQLGPAVGAARSVAKVMDEHASVMPYAVYRLALGHSASTAACTQQVAAAYGLACCARALDGGGRQMCCILASAMAHGRCLHSRHGRRRHWAKLWLRRP